MAPRGPQPQINCPFTRSCNSRETAGASVLPTSPKKAICSPWWEPSLLWSPAHWTCKTMDFFHRHHSWLSIHKRKIHDSNTNTANGNSGFSLEETILFPKVSKYSFTFPVPLKFSKMPFCPHVSSENTFFPPYLMLQIWKTTHDKKKIARPGPCFFCCLSQHSLIWTGKYSEENNGQVDLEISDWPVLR